MLAALAATAGRAAAQGTGATAATLLELPATARAAAFHGAGAALLGDEGSVFVNPAGMATVRRLSLGGSVERGPFGTQLSTGAFVVRQGRFDFGFGVMLLDVGGDSVIVPDAGTGGEVGVPTGALIEAYQTLGVVALGYRRGLLSIGGNLKFVREVIDDGSAAPYRASGATGDIGLAIAFFDISALGVTVQHIGGGLDASDGTRFAMPRTTRIGFALNLVEPQGTVRLLSITEHVLPPGGDAYWILGAEGGVVVAGVGVLGRVGYATGRAPSGRSDVALGGELRFHSLRVEYAYQEADALAAGTHRVGVRFLP